MSNSLHSSVVFNALQSHPELEIIGNELITRIKAIIKNPQVVYSTSNGLNRLNFFDLIELTQDAKQCGFISTPDSVQIENIKFGNTPTNLPVWGGNYIGSSAPSKTKLPLIGFGGFYLPISILHALKYGEHHPVKNYIVNAVLFQLIQEKPELFCAPMRSLHWASSYIHYIEQIFNLENTSIDGLPFISLDTAEIYALCETVEQVYVEKLLDSDLVDLFCFYSFNSYKHGDIHQQYVRFANCFGFAKDQLINQYKKAPIAYALSVLYSDLSRISDPLIFESFTSSQIMSNNFYKQICGQQNTTQRLLLRNLSTLLNMAKYNRNVKMVHNLYLHTINTYPHIALTNEQLNNHFKFLERAKFIELLSVEQFTAVMLGLDATLKGCTDKQVIHAIFNTAELIQICLMGKDESLRKSADIDQLKLIAKIKNKIDLDCFNKDGFATLLDLFIELKNSTDVDCIVDGISENIIELEPFEYYNGKLSLVLISQTQDIKSTLSRISTDEKFHAEVLNHNRNLIRFNFNDEEGILVVDPRMEGFKFLFENIVSTTNEPVSELVHNAVNLTLQQINFGH